MKENKEINALRKELLELRKRILDSNLPHHMKEPYLSIKELIELKIFN